MSGGWVTGPAERADAGVRLFCFAHAGGGGTFFRPWRSVLAPEVELWPVTLPGRENRIREQPYHWLGEVLAPLHAALHEHFDRPFALFGHSMGTLLAYELARLLSGNDRLLSLFVSGRRAPHLPARHPPLHRLPDAEFIERVSAMNGTPTPVLREPALLELFLPALRADFELNETYTPLPGPRLTCPVIAMVGAADPEADLDEMAAWRSTTTGPFTLRVFRGDHFYLKGAPAGMLATLRADVRRARAAVDLPAQS